MIQVTILVEDGLRITVGKLGSCFLEKRYDGMWCQKRLEEKISTNEGETRIHDIKAADLIALVLPLAINAIRSAQEHT